MGLIVYPKSWIAGEVLTAADLNAEFAAVTDQVNGNLDNSNIAPGANVDGSKLADNSVPILKVAATAFVKIAIANSLLIDTVEMDVAVLPSLTLSGSRVRLEGSPLTLSILQTGTGSLTFKWYEDNVLLSGSDVTIDVASPAADGGVIVALPVPTFVREGAAAGAHIYKLTAQTTDNKLQIITSGSGNVGFLYATEER